MERLTLEEAIKHAKEVADMNYNDAEKFDSNDSVENYMKANCMKCAEEHEQLAEWLEELKSYKDIGTPKELKELKENGAFTGLELAKLAIMQKELKKYKDLERQGLLVRLLCKVGDIVYDSSFGYPEPHMVKAISYGYCIGYVEPKIENEIIFYCENYTNTMKVIFPMKELGKTIFLTREEAEKKLEEMKK